MNTTKTIKDTLDSVWAVDIALDSRSVGEVQNEESINQNIEIILSTSFGERLFNPTFGSAFSTQIFKAITGGHGEQLLDDVIKAIKKWEPRIIILERDCKLYVDRDNNSVTITLPYIITSTGLVSSFSKKAIM